MSEPRSETVTLVVTPAECHAIYMALLHNIDATSAIAVSLDVSPSKRLSLLHGAKHKVADVLAGRAAQSGRDEHD